MDYTKYTVTDFQSDIENKVVLQEKPEIYYVFVYFSNGERLCFECATEKLYILAAAAESDTQVEDIIEDYEAEILVIGCQLTADV